MIIISQRDPRWGFKPIGKTRVLIKDKGCLITDLSMLSDWYGTYKDPSWMSKYLSFTDQALLLWNSITSSQLPLKFVWRFYNYDEKRIINALNGKTTSCVLQVHGNHWVVGIKKVLNYYWVADPWDAKRKLIHKSVISGGAVLDKK